MFSSVLERLLKRTKPHTVMVQVCEVSTCARGFFGGGVVSRSCSVVVLLVSDGCGDGLPTGVVNRYGVLSVPDGEVCALMGDLND